MGCWECLTDLGHNRRDRGVDRRKRLSHVDVQAPRASLDPAGKRALPPQHPIRDPSRGQAAGSLTPSGTLGRESFDAAAAAPTLLPPESPPDLDVKTADSAADKVAWIGKNAIAFRTIDPKDENFSDLGPLRRAIGSARFVLLGGSDDVAVVFAKYRLVRPTLQVQPRDRPRMARGQDGSLFLSCTTLSFAASCRFIRALSTHECGG
jgi:hypothetical protein